MNDHQRMGPREMAVWIIALLLLAVIITSPVACTINRQRLIAEAIRNGADPLAAKCAIESSGGDGYTSPLCMAAALSKK